MNTQRIIDRLDQFMRHKGLNDNRLTVDLELSIGLLGKSRKKGKDLSDRVVELILSRFHELNRVWLITGEGKMLNGSNEQEETPQNNLIPFYDNVTSIGGISQFSADMQGISNPTDFIDAGDWFRGATSAIRHYGDSMVEYPSGCIIVLKEVYDRYLLIPGKDYVIETSEFRLTKRIQKGHSDGYISAYSTNNERYADGRLIHEPFDIPIESIKRVSLVLGYIVKN